MRTLTLGWSWGSTAMLVIGAIWSSAPTCPGAEQPLSYQPIQRATYASPSQAPPQLGMPLSSIPAPYREAVRRLVEKPTFSMRGPAEVFTGQPELYRWFLDHPDQAVRVWRRLGAKCMDITGRGNGRFTCTDGQGTTISWETVVADGRRRVWYATGTAKPAPLLPAIPVRALLVLHHADTQDEEGQTLIQHRADLFLGTDSKAVALVTRMLGSSAPRVAHQGLGQIEMFFSALVWYLDRHPERWEALLLENRTTPPAQGTP